MGGLSLWHWIIVLLVVLILFGRGRVSEIMGDFGKGIKSFKHGLHDDDDKPAPPPPVAAPPPVQIAPTPPVQAPPPVQADTQAGVPPVAAPTPEPRQD